ncbi:hypothetical protein [Variovorax sp. UC122_21]|uniref:hypothetical protein n=1 Tax=unclassified Variovorax TaxID=663243 RepID=UPI003757EB9A
MTEKLVAHWRAKSNTYPKKFILTPAQHKEYERLRVIGSFPPTDSMVHMGVPIELAEGTPGVMVAADGDEVSLLGTSDT